MHAEELRPLLSAPHFRRRVLHQCDEIRGGGRYEALSPETRRRALETISADNISMPGMRKLFVCNTRIGPFYIAEIDGRFHPVYEDESLGSYERPEQAAEDVAGGHTFSISSGIDTATLGIPEDLSEWGRMA